MKFQEYLKMKGHIYESEIADILKEADSLMEGYSYGGGVLNEAADPFMEQLEAYLYYMPAMEMIEDGGKWQKALADQWMIPAKQTQAKLKLSEVRGKLNAAYEKMPRGDQKTALNRKIESLDLKINQIEKSTESEKAKLAEAYRKISDEDLKKMSDKVSKNASLSAIFNNKKTAQTQLWAPDKGIKFLEYKMQQEQKQGKKDAAIGYQTRLKEAEEKYETALKKFEDAEEVGEEDLNQLDGIEEVKPELINITKAGREFKSTRISLADLADDMKTLKDNLEPDAPSPSPAPAPSPSPAP